MEFSENDVILIGTAAPGSLVIIDAGQVIKVGEQSGGSVSLMIMGCQLYALCENDASTIADHPIIGQVPACERCRGTLS